LLGVDEGARTSAGRRPGRGGRGHGRARWPRPRDRPRPAARASSVRWLLRTRATGATTPVRPGRPRLPPPQRRPGGPTPLRGPACAASTRMCSRCSRRTRAWQSTAIQPPRGGRPPPRRPSRPQPHGHEPRAVATPPPRTAAVPTPAPTTVPTRGRRGQGATGDHRSSRRPGSGPTRQAATRARSSTGDSSSGRGAELRTAPQVAAGPPPPRPS
jgi:hypothetical protein